MHVKFIASRRNPALWEATVTLMQRAVEAAMEQASGGLEPGASNALQSLDYRQFEEVAIKILSSYSTYHDWKRAVSCPNEYGQTLAHLAVTLGYTRLLERLIYWGIDLSVRDATGATALRFYDHPDCVALLNRNGANQQIRDGSPPPEDSGSGCPTIPGLSARDDASTILTESVSPPPYTKSPSEAEHHYTLRQAPSRAQNWNSQPASPPNVMLLSPPPSAVRVHPNHVRIRHRLLHYPKILGKIFAYSSSLHLRAEAPFLQDHTTKPWLESLRDLKSLCLVSRTFHTSAAPLLYTHIRLRRIPQLSALVVSLQLNYKRVSKSRTFTPSLRLGECTQSLDLSFFIPKEWNTLYVNDLIALLSMLPNLTSFRSRPCLPMLSQSGVPLPRPVPSSILLALAHSLRNNSLLNELELTQQESPALADLTTLLQNSVNLTTLTLGLYIFDSGSALSTAPASIRLPSLQSLRLHVTMNRPKGVLTARPAAHFMVDAIRWAMPKLRNLSLVLDHDIQALSSDSSFGGILHGFLNMHGHGLQHLSITETAPHLRSRELDVSSLVSKCPVLECLTVGIVGCAPVRMVVPHIRLRRVQFVGTFGWISGGGDVLREHGRRALKIQADEVRTGKFPGLRDIVLTDEREVPRGWTEVMRSVKVSIMCLRASEEGDENVWSDGEGSDDEDWIPSPSEGDDDLSSEGDEDDGWYTDAYAAGHGADGEKSDHEMVKNPSGRTTSYTGDDQIDHQGALEIFKKTLERIVGLPKNEDPNNEADNAGPPALVRVSLPVVVPAPIPTKVSTPASLQYQHPSSSPTHHRRLNSGAGDLSRTTTVSGHQRKLSKDQGLNRIHPSAPPSAHFGLLPVVGSLRGNSSAQGHHRRLSNGGERPTLPPLSLSAQQSHTVPITITSPTPSSSKGAPTPTFTFGSSSRGAEAKADGDEGTVGSARRKVLKTGSLKWKPQP